LKNRLNVAVVLLHGITVVLDELGREAHRRGAVQSMASAAGLLSLSEEVRSLEDLPGVAGKGALVSAAICMRSR
jgi:hypothetical protein